MSRVNKIVEHGGICQFPFFVPLFSTKVR